MNFITSSFVLFFLPVLCLLWAVRGHARVFLYVLPVVSLVFYAFAGPVYLLLLLAVAFLAYGTGRWLAAIQSPGLRKLLILADVFLHILILGFFKYYEFLLMDIPGCLGLDSSAIFSQDIAEIALPVGLSFYTFQGLSYAIDHYRKTAGEPKSFIEVLAFVSFFPTIMSGPIMRAGDFFPQIGPVEASKEDFSAGSLLIISGLFKKVVLSTYLAEHAADPVFMFTEDYSSMGVLLGVYAYTIQIYCDFSGYTDIALGVGRLMGFRLPPNFNAPYRSLNLQEFWRRWHISLSLWLRDYVYISFGGNRKGNRYVNLLLTMLIGGLWHGSGLRFIIWGFFHGLGLVVVHAFHKLRKRLGWEDPAGVAGWPLKALAWLLTFHFVAALWIFFRAEDMDSALMVCDRIVNYTEEGKGVPLMVPVLALFGLVMPLYGTKLQEVLQRGLSRTPWVVQAVVVALLAGFVMNMGPEGTLPFIYFSF